MLKVGGLFSQFQRLFRIPEPLIFAGGIEPGKVIEHLGIFRFKPDRLLVGFYGLGILFSREIQIPQRAVQFRIVRRFFQFASNDFLKKVSVQLLSGFTEVKLVTDCTD